MKPIEANLIPDLEGYDVISAKKFFKVIGELGAAFHADDPADTIINGPTGVKLFTTDAAKKVDAAVAALKSASLDWADQDFLYTLAGTGAFKLEEDYPGFIVDRCIPAADRTGYESLPGQELPTVVVEDMSQFVAIQIFPGTGRLTEATEFKVVPTTGARFDGAGFIDVSGIKLDFDNARVTQRFAFLDGLVEETIMDIRGPRI